MDGQGISDHMRVEDKKGKTCPGREDSERQRPAPTTTWPRSRGRKSLLSLQGPGRGKCGVGEWGHVGTRGRAMPFGVGPTLGLLYKR